MKKFMLTVSMASIVSLGSGVAFAAGGHGGSKGSSGGGAYCEKPRISKFNPPPLETVAPNSEFSFLAAGIKKVSDVEVSIKKNPVEVTSEQKGSAYLFSGKLPADLKGVPVRIQVNAKGKKKKCSTTKGWLVKVSE